MGWTAKICVLPLHYIPWKQWKWTNIFLMFGDEPEEDWLAHLNNCCRYYRDDKGKIILAELCKLWKHQATYLKDICNGKDNSIPSKPANNSKFEIGQVVIVRNHANQNLVLNVNRLQSTKILHERTLLLITPNGKSSKH